MFGVNFNFPAVSMMQTVFTVIIGFGLIFIIALYLAITWKLGETLKIFFINYFKNDKVIQEFSLNEVKLINSKDSLPYKPYSINGVRLFLRYNLNPELPKEYLIIVKHLVSFKIDNIENVTPEHLTPFNMTVDEFKTLHQLITRKYYIKMSINDVDAFEDMHLDEHGRKTSIETKITEILRKKQSTSYQKWSFIIIFIMVIGSLIIKGYRMMHEGR
jgi:hypothetical protein